MEFDELPDMVWRAISQQAAFVGGLGTSSLCLEAPLHALSHALALCALQPEETREAFLSQEAATAACEQVASMTAFCGLRRRLRELASVPVAERPTPRLTAMRVQIGAQQLTAAAAWLMQPDRQWVANGLLRIVLRDKYEMPLMPPGQACQYVNRVFAQALDTEGNHTQKCCYGPIHQGGRHCLDNKDRTATCPRCRVVHSP